MHRFLYTTVSLAAAAGFAACDLGEPLGVTQPLLSAGAAGRLPAVTDVRRAGGIPVFSSKTPLGRCADGKLSLTVRFSQPMNRDNVEDALALAEVVGDVEGDLIPLSDNVVRPSKPSIRWEDNDRSISFDAAILPDRQYVLTLPKTVTNRAGLGLDGRVGYDVDGDGREDIQSDPQQFARADDDYLAKPSDYLSLPLFLCTAETAPAIWRTPLNESRPRVLEFIGVMPNGETPPAYRPTNGGFPFGTRDESLSVEKPLPDTGILRVRVASPNTAPTRPFAQRFGPTPILPSTLVGNFEVVDDGLNDYSARMYADDRLRIALPLVGTAAQAYDNVIVADDLASVPAGALAGMTFVARGRNDYVYTLPITGNAGSALFLDAVYHRSEFVRRIDYNAVIYFTTSAFRENELLGLRIQQVNANHDFVARGNGATRVQISGTNSSCGPVSGFCTFEIYTDTHQMGLLSQSFEIAPTYVYLKTEEKRADEQRYRLRLNKGADPVADVFGYPFIDGRYDGDDTADSPADDLWTGYFTSGNYLHAPIPPKLQLNDGRWYSPFPGGTTVGATATFAPYGEYTHLAHGVMGRHRVECPEGKPVKALIELGLLFATPDGQPQTAGDNDLLLTDSVNASNIGLFLLEGYEPHALPLAVTAVTIHHEFYGLDGSFLMRQPATLVRLSAGPTLSLIQVAGDDGLCGTTDDRAEAKVRSFQAGDRLLISHRVKFPHGDLNSLDGNYDGIVSDSGIDDIIFEYQPAVASELFRRAN